MRDFDDSLLDAPGLVDDEGLRWLAGAGARFRSAMLTERIGSPEFGRPRGVIALGAEARLVRAVLEPVCPVPFVAWPAEGLRDASPAKLPTVYTNHDKKTALSFQITVFFLELHLNIL